MGGTLRENLDPFSQYDDATLNDALRSAGLYSISSSDISSSTSSTIGDAPEHKYRNLTLDSEVEAGGSNFSLGQRYFGRRGLVG